MKKFLILTGLLLCIKLFSQTITETETASLDEMLSNINQSSVTSGIIYERTAQFANLYNFNSASDYRTANYKMFIQALTEMYNASNKSKFISYDSLKELLKSTSQDNVVDLGILNTPFQAINYSEENPSQGGLTLNTITNKFEQISGKNPFLTLQTTVISPLKDYVKGKNITFNIKNELYFKNNYKNIKSLTADFSDGITRTIINNGVLSNQSIIVNYTSGGKKTLIFNVTYDDNTTLTSYGEIYLKYSNVIQNKIVPAESDPLIEDGSIQAEESFQGYDEPFPFKGKIDYRIFYHTNNGTGAENKKLLKPIIILDGFDPGDVRKIQKSDYINYRPGIDKAIVEDMMVYFAKTPNGNINHYLVAELRSKGFDVVIINHPTYCVSNTAPYSLVNYNATNNTCSNNGKLVNGGADFIERNGLNLVALIKNFNATVTSNGSSEQLVIVGPSMGGQISRYALSYMEKKGWQHNTRLWISIDSPHLGANIPYGVQSLVYYLRDESPAAEDFYNYQLGSPAAKQQLIEDHLVFDGFRIPTGNALNGKTISQGFSTTKGSSFFINHYNAQFNNGLPNSKGYPQNLRKISIVNGSLTGSKKTLDAIGNEIQGYGNDNELTINVRGFERLCFFWCWKVHVASMETYTMPSLNTTSKIARFKKGFKDRSLFLPNVNTRGNMDTVPGGYFPAYDVLANEIMGQSVPWSDWWILGPYFGFGQSVNLELRNNRKIHSFIPTFSALGIKNPDRNWGESLQRNLVCTGETPFDSYYGSSENTQHTSFTEESVTWLMKELGDNATPPSPQAPNFPIDATQFSGPSAICLNSTNTYSFPDPCKLPSGATWSLNNTNAQIVSSTGSSVNLKGITSGSVILTATFQNGQTLTKTIWVGSPIFHIEPDPSNSNNYVIFNAIPEPSNISFEQMGVADTNIVWKRLDNGQTRTGASYTAHAPGQNWSFDVEVKATNSCGTFTTYATITPPPAMPCETFVLAKTNQNNNYSILKSVDPDCPIINGKTAETYQITVANSMGVIIISKTGDSFDLSTHPIGMYVVNIQKNNQTIINQTIIKN